MQYRLPILAADRSCIPEVCSDAALLLPLSSTQRWADAIRTLIESPALREDLSTRSALRGKDFSWQLTWTHLDNAFDAALARRTIPQFQPQPTGPARPLVATH
jgi:glycosyltransferase involved in cell wall biosynthesis